MSRLQGGLALWAISFSCSAPDPLGILYQSQGTLRARHRFLFNPRAYSVRGLSDEQWEMLSWEHSKLASARITRGFSEDHTPANILEEYVRAVVEGHR